jgi:hypothetical protein
MSFNLTHEERTALWQYWNIHVDFFAPSFRPHAATKTLSGWANDEEGYVLHESDPQLHKSLSDDPDASKLPQPDPVHLVSATRKLGLSTWTKDDPRGKMTVTEALSESSVAK